MALRLENIKYKDIINDVSFDFEDGKVYSVLSSNVKEKETLSKIISGVIDDYSGKITSDGSKNNINYVCYNTDDMFIGQTFLEELSFPLLKYNYREDTIQKKVDSIIKMLHLDSNIKKRNSFELSDGEKRLLSIGISLVTNPKILILNNPTLYLDDYHKKIIIKLFKKIARRYNKIIIIFTSDVLFSYDVCDNFILLKDGLIIKSDSKKKMVDIEDELNSVLGYFPRIIDFINAAYKMKNISLEKTYDIKELMKDIYRNAKY